MIREAVGYQSSLEGLAILQEQMRETLTPWIVAKTADYLPIITIKELWRGTKRAEVPMTAGEIYDLLLHTPPVFEIGDERIQTKISRPSFLTNGVEQQVLGDQINNDYLAARVSFYQQNWAQRNGR